MDPSKIIIFTQFVVQIVLVGLVIWLLIKDRRKNAPDPVAIELKRLLGEIQNYQEELTKVFQDKSEHIAMLMDDLDAKVREAKNIKSKMDMFISQENSNPKTFTRQDVLRLAKNGLSQTDIAQATGIPIGEVQLILKFISQD